MGRAAFRVGEEEVKDGSSFRICEHCGARVEGMYVCECQKESRIKELGADT